MQQVGQKPPAPWVVPSLALPGPHGGGGTETCGKALQRSKLAQGEAGVQAGQQPAPGCPLYLGSR